MKIMCVMIGVLVAVLILHYGWSYALAHDAAAMRGLYADAAPKDKQRNDWYRTLKSNGGGSCCDLTDAAHLDQRYARQLADRSWEVFLTDLQKWVPVPPDRVVHNKPSIDGEPYLFRYPSVLYDGSLIRCFVPPIPGF